MASGPNAKTKTSVRRERPSWGKRRLEQHLIGSFESLPPQLQVAGRYLLDHPQDVALCSMRELARDAGLPPATMTRLARQLGFEGYDDLKRLYAEEVRQYAVVYRERASELADPKRGKDASALASEMVTGIARQVDALGAPESVAALVAGAALMGAARTIYCLGQRLSFPPAYIFQYIHSVAGGSSALLDAPGGTGLDALRQASSEDVVLAISVSPYTRTTVEQTAFAHERGIPVVAITDSAVSPLAKFARQLVLVSTKSRSFFQTMAAVAAAAETLATLTAMGCSGRALDGLKSSEDYFSAARTYWSTAIGRGPGLITALANLDALTGASRAGAADESRAKPVRNSSRRRRGSWGGQ